MCCFTVGSSSVLYPLVIFISRLFFLFPLSILLPLFRRHFPANGVFLHLTQISVNTEVRAVAFCFSFQFTNGRVSITHQIIIPALHTPEEIRTLVNALSPAWNFAQCTRQGLDLGQRWS